MPTAAEQDKPQTDAAESQADQKTTATESKADKEKPKRQAWFATSRQQEENDRIRELIDGDIYEKLS